MGEESQPAIARGFGKTTVQLSLQMPESKAGSEWEIMCEAADLPTEVQQRVEVIQQLIAVRGTKHYAKVQQQAAQRLENQRAELATVGEILARIWDCRFIATAAFRPRRDQN